MKFNSMSNVINITHMLQLSEPKVSISKERMVCTFTKLFKLLTFIHPRNQWCFCHHWSGEGEVPDDSQGEVLGPRGVGRAVRTVSHRPDQKQPLILTFSDQFLFMAMLSTSTSLSFIETFWESMSSWGRSASRWRSLMFTRDQSQDGCHWGASLGKTKATIEER